MTSKKLSIKYCAPAELIPYKNNARTHSDKQVKEIEASIKEFGFTAPILIGADCTILAGHGRLMAAKNIGLTEVPTIELSQLNEVQRRAYILADNKLALNAGWDDDLLAFEVNALTELEFNVELVGFSVDEITELNFDGNFDPASETEQGNLDKDSNSQIECPKCGHQILVKGYV